MKILFYSPYSLDSNNLPVLLDEAVEYLQDRNNQVWFITCGGDIRPCLSNPEQSSIRCLECKLSSRLLVKQIDHPNFIHKELSHFNHEEVSERVKSLHFEYDSIEGVKSICHAGVNIGLGVVSSYVTMTRNLNPQFNEANRSYMDDSLRAAALLVELTHRMVDEFQPDLLCLFNGRFNGLRPVMETSRKRGIPTAILECTFSTSIERQRKVKFMDTMPQDIDYCTTLIEDNWRDYDGQEDREKVATDFFEKRRRNQMASDNVYTGNQDHALLPSDWNPEKRNFVIFNSSEDEFFCVGESFDRHKIFNDQIAGIRHLVEKTAGDPTIHYYLRIHPNLLPVKFAYHTELAKIFANYQNITVIPASSPISTYRMIDHCEKVFVFGSTAGVEATFWGKPVVLMGGSLYMHMNVAYIPGTLDELDELTIAKLEPKPRIGALKYALFLFGERGSLYKYIDFNYRRLRIGGKILAVPLCFKYKNSLLPYVTFAACFRTLNLIPHLIFKKIRMKSLLVEKGANAELAH
jgi:hypothetical protein